MYSIGKEKKENNIRLVFFVMLGWIIIIGTMYLLLIRFILFEEAFGLIDLKMEMETIKIQNRLLTNKEVLESIASRKIIKSNEYSTEEKLRSLDDYIESDIFQRMGIIMPNGIVTTNYGEEGYLGDKEYFKDIMNGEKYTVALKKGTFSNNDIVVSAVPIINDGNIIGVLTSACLQEDSFFKRNLFEYDGISMYILDENGSIITNDENGNLKLSFGIDLYKELLSENSVEKIDEFRDNIKNKKSSILGAYISGEKVYLKNIPLSDSKLSLVASVKLEYIFDYYKEAIMKSSYIMASVTLFILLSGVLIIKVISKANRIKYENERKKNFFANITHEIRTPMNAILGMSKIALKEIQNKEQVEKSLNIIVTSSEYLLNILNNILDISIINSGKVNLIENQFYLSDVLDRVGQIIHSKIIEKNQIFKINSYEDLSLVGDYVKLEQILINLLANANKFTNENGKINLDIATIHKGNDYIKLKIKVSDNGIGMSDEFVKRIFIPYEREDIWRNSKASGAGLGLPITKKLIEMMAGHIDVSTEVGIGSVFTVTLEFKLVSSNINFNKTNKSITLVNNINSYYTGKRLLLVEDDYINIIIAREIITSLGFEIVEAKNGQQAVDKFIKSENCKFDIILMDLQMPIMNGIDATREIRASRGRYGKTIPIIAMSSMSLDILESDCVGIDASYNIQKPIIKEELIEIFNCIFSS